MVITILFSGCAWPLTGNVPGGTTVNELREQAPDVDGGVIDDKTNPENRSDDVVEISNTSDANTVEQIDTSDWLTYESDEYDFTIKYPANWMPVHSKSNDVIVGFREQELRVADPDFSEIYLSARDNSAELTLHEYYEGLSDDALADVPNYFLVGTPDDVVVDSIQSVLFNSVPGAVENTVTAIPVDKIIFELARHNDFPSSAGIYYSMLSTLEFS